jgi:hypothetical protein
VGVSTYGLVLPRGASSVFWLWDRRVVEKIEECVREYTVACSFIYIKDGFSWAFAGDFLGLILIMLEGPYGRS